MDTAEELRKTAQRCFKLAQDAVTVGIQIHWIDVAQRWLDLARYIEEHTFAGETGPSLVPNQNPSCPGEAREQ